MLRSFLKPAILALALAAPASAFAQMTDSEVGDAGAAVLRSDRDAAVVRRIHNVPSVGVVMLSGGPVNPVSHLGMDITDVQIYAQKFPGRVAALRHALAANPATAHALHANGVDIAQVIGVQIGSSGSLRVYTN